MTNTEYRTWLIEEIAKDRKSWMKRNKITKDDLKKRSTRSLEIIYDHAK